MAWGAEARAPAPPPGRPVRVEGLLELLPLGPTLGHAALVALGRQAPGDVPPQRLVGPGGGGHEQRHLAGAADLGQQPAHLVLAPAGAPRHPAGPGGAPRARRGGGGPLRPGRRAQIIAQPAEQGPAVQLQAALSGARGKVRGLRGRRTASGRAPEA